MQARLKSTNATHASQVQWDELAKKMEGTMTGDEVEGLWIQLRLSLIDYKEKTFQGPWRFRALKRLTRCQRLSSLS